MLIKLINIELKSIEFFEGTTKRNEIVIEDYLSIQTFLNFY